FIHKDPWAYTVTVIVSRNILQGMWSWNCLFGVFTVTGISFLWDRDMRITDQIRVCGIQTVEKSNVISIVA
ncbi:MAG: hypothetical protein WCH07_06165, partial [Deltaproteobacteria bacterium]